MPNVNPQPHHAFRIEYPNVVNALKTHVAVLDFEKKKTINYVAIWDTGATNTVITGKVVAELGLIPTGMIEMRGVNNTSMKPTYLINLLLPNKVMFENLNASEGELPEIDVLIGMDVIGAGDFSISNHKKTIFSFSFPSHEKRIDLVERAEKINQRNIIQPKYKKLGTREGFQ